MADEAEWIEAEVGNAGAGPPAPGGGEETKRKRGRLKGSLNKNKKSNKDRTPKAKTGTKRRRRQRTSDRDLSVPVVLGDLGRGVAAGIRQLRERRPAPNAFFDRDSDSYTEVSRFCSSLHICRAMNYACCGVSPSPFIIRAAASYALATGFFCFKWVNNAPLSPCRFASTYFIHKNATDEERCNFL
jgi:hypothetical protein